MDLPRPAPPWPRVRDALPGDRPAIVDFNARLARETEGKALDPTVLARGVRAALADPDRRLRYWVAELEPGGPVVGQAAISREWSDWRDGWLWWFQSVYVHPEARGQGVFRTLHGHVPRPRPRLRRRHRPAALRRGRQRAGAAGLPGPGDAAGGLPRLRGALDPRPAARGSLSGWPLVGTDADRPIDFPRGGGDSEREAIGIELRGTAVAVGAEIPAIVLLDQVIEGAEAREE